MVEDYWVGDKVRKYKTIFTMAASGVALPFYSYGTHFRNFYPTEYQSHLNAINDFAMQNNIPYDPDFQRNYLGSFAGALTAVGGFRLIASSYEEIKWINKNKNQTFQTVAELNEYTLEKNRIDSLSTASAFTSVAILLTGHEIVTSQAPNRSFDYGDMSAYALAFGLMAGGLAMTTRKAVQSAKAHIASFEN